jgi:hypothetical protein
VGVKARIGVGDQIYQGWPEMLERLGESCPDIAGPFHFSAAASYASSASRSSSGASFHPL